MRSQSAHLKSGTSLAGGGGGGGAGKSEGAIFCSER